MGRSDDQELKISGGERRFKFAVHNSASSPHSTHIAAALATSSNGHRDDDRWLTHLDSIRAAQFLLVVLCNTARSRDDAEILEVSTFHSLSLIIFDSRETFTNALRHTLNAHSHARACSSAESPSSCWRELKTRNSLSHSWSILRSNGTGHILHFSFSLARPSHHAPFSSRVSLSPLRVRDCD